MADVGDNNFMKYIYRGEEGEIIPWGATHITVAEDVTFVRSRAFYEHDDIIEVICHENVKKIERWAFNDCPNLKRVIMPGVKEVEEEAFSECRALTDVECGKLEIIGRGAFGDCVSLRSMNSLRSINLPFVRIVQREAFWQCKALTEVKFGNNLLRFDDCAFFNCRSLERITIPLKDGLMISRDDIFQACKKLQQIDLLEGELHETIATLHLEEWRNDMKEEIDSINQILPNAAAGGDDEDNGDKARAIRRWIRSVLGKISRYKVEHKWLLNEAATTLQIALPHDIVTNNVLPFLELHRTRLKLNRMR